MSRCPQCSAEHAIARRFCTRCGARLSDTAPHPAPPTLRGERRHVVVLFAELSGLALLAEKGDPEELTRIANAYFALLSRPIRAEGGTIDKFIGDCVMAVFGAPLAHEDDPARALRAALTMREALGAPDVPAAGAIALAVGIASGPVMAGFIGASARRDYTVMGDVVNVAKRLQQAAGAGRILVYERTAAGAGPSFRFALEPPVQAKGRAEPVPVRLLLGDGHPAGGQRPIAPAISLDLAGRDDVWERLLHLAGRARGGRGGVVALTGDPGIGKSRLALHLIRHVAERGATVWEGHARSADLELALGPFIDLLRQAAGAEALASPEDLERRIRTVAPVSGLTPLESRRLTQLVLPSPAQESPEWDEGARRRTELHSAFAKLLCRPSKGAMSFVVLEDWHHADAQSQELLHHLASEARDRAVLILVLERPGTHPRAWPSGTEVVTILPLDARARRSLIQMALRGGEVPDEIVERLAKTAGGNPLFLLQILQAWLASGTLRVEEGRYALAEQEARLPDSVQAVITARIDRLPPPERSVLLHAAVLGPTFPENVLLALERRLVGADAGAVGDRLSRLVRADLLRRSDASGTLSFPDDLVREVALGTLLHTNLRAIHQLAAESYEASETIVPPTVLVSHWMQAEDPARALPYLMTSGDQSLAAGDRARSLAEYERALAIMKDEPSAATPARLAHVHARLGDILLARAEYARAESAFTAALEGCHRAAVPTAEIFRGLATVAQRTGRYHDAIAFCQEGILASAGTPLLAASLEALAGTICCDEGRFVEAEGWIGRGLARLAGAAAGSGGRRVEAALHRGKGRTLLGLSRPSEAAVEFEEELEILEREGDAWEASNALLDLAEACAEVGDHSRAAQTYARALPAKELLGDRWGLALGTHGLARLHAGWGDAKQALDESAAALRLALDLGDPKLVSKIRCVRGRALFATGEPALAARELQAAMDGARAIGATPELIEAELGLSGIELEQGSFDAAFAAATAAHDAAVTASSKAAIAASLMALGRAFAAQGDYGQAEERYETARRAADELHSPPLRLTVLAAEGELHLARGQYDRALAVFRELREAASGTRDRVKRGVAALGMAEIHLRRGETEACARAADEALDDFRATGSPKREAQVYELLSRLCTNTAAYEKAEAYARSAVAIYSGQGAFGLRELGHALLALGYVYYESVDPDRMRAAFEQGLSCLSRYGDRAGVASAYRAVAVAHTKDDPEQAIALVGESLAIAREVGNLLGQAEALGDLGEVRRRLGDLDGALDAFLKEEQIFRDIGYERGLAINAFHLASIHYARGDLGRAMEWVSKNIWVSNRVGNIGRLYGLEFRGQIETDLGRLEEARADLDQALELGRSLRHAMRLANIHRTRAEHFLAQGHLEAADAEIRSGRQVAARLAEESLKEYGYLVRERLSVMEARLHLARGAAEAAADALEAPLQAFRKYRTPLPELEALLVLCEARVRLGDEAAGSSLDELLSRARSLSLLSLEVDALALKAELTRDAALAERASELARRLGAPPRIARIRRLAESL